MNPQPTVLLTNDDGSESPGIQALYQNLTNIANVTVVAPVTDQSAIGRTLSNRVSVTSHGDDYLVEGTPSDCVLIGLYDLEIDPDIVVSGCNVGPNLGAYGFGRSGTLGAAIEAAYHNVPGIAVSLYVSYDDFSQNIKQAKFAEAVSAAEYLVKRTQDSSLFEHADYINVNVPVADGNACDMKVTRPAQLCAVTVSREEGRIHLADHSWKQMDQSETPPPEGSDHWAVRNQNISVTPLHLPCEPDQSEKFLPIVKRYKTETK
jgi:5'-nucleotidase